MCRSALDGAAHQSCGSDRSDSHGCPLWVRSRQRPLHIHDLLSSVLTAPHVMFFNCAIALHLYTHILRVSFLYSCSQIFSMQIYLCATFHFYSEVVSYYYYSEGAVCCFVLCRPISETDLQASEKRLMQNMDMIISKKKRFAAIDPTTHACGSFHFPSQPPTPIHPPPNCKNCTSNENQVGYVHLARTDARHAPCVLVCVAVPSSVVQSQGDRVALA